MSWIRYSRLIQSYASLSTAITVLISAPRIQKFHRQIREKRAKFIHRAGALPSCISLSQGNQRRKYQARGGRRRKQKISLQRVKVRTRMSVKRESRKFRAAALLGRCWREICKIATNKNSQSPLVAGWELMPKRAQKKKAGRRRRKKAASNHATQVHVHVCKVKQ